LKLAAGQKAKFVARTKIRSRWLSQRAPILSATDIANFSRPFIRTLTRSTWRLGFGKVNYAECEPNIAAQPARQHALSQPLTAPLPSLRDPSEPKREPNHPSAANHPHRRAGNRRPAIGQSRKYPEPKSAAQPATQQAWLVLRCYA